MTFWREVFDKIGTFQLGYGCDETHFCIRLRQKWPDKILLYVPKVKVFHRVPEIRANLNYFRKRCYFEGGYKAVVSWLVGMWDGLSSEWAYTFRVLLHGVFTGLKELILGRNQFGVLRAGTIVAFAFTGGAPPDDIEK